MGFIGNILRTAMGVFFRAVLIGIVMAALSLGVVAYIARYVVKEWPPSNLTIAAGVAIALLAGYAGITTILLRGVARGALAAAKDVEKDVAKVL